MLCPALVVTIAFGVSTAPSCVDEDRHCVEVNLLGVDVSLDSERAPDLASEHAPIEVYACTEEGLAFMRLEEGFSSSSEEHSTRRYYIPLDMHFVEMTGQRVPRALPIDLNFEFCGEEACYSWLLRAMKEHVRGIVPGCGDVKTGLEMCGWRVMHREIGYPGRLGSPLPASLDEAWISTDGFCRERALREGFEGVR